MLLLPGVETRFRISQWVTLMKWFANPFYHNAPVSFSKRTIVQGFTHVDRYLLISTNILSFHSGKAKMSCSLWGCQKNKGRGMNCSLNGVETSFSRSFFIAAFFFVCLYCSIFRLANWMRGGVGGDDADLVSSSTRSLSPTLRPLSIPLIKSIAVHGWTLSHFWV